tara:strand:+ start:543 stop:1184 length:642 start_codon:yes stop_codon:yes gene_type:complete
MHRRNKRAIVRLLVILALPFTFLESVLAVPPLEEKLSGLASITTQFRQQTSRDREVHHGRLWVKKPNKFRYETTSPWQQSLVSNGQIFWNYDTDLEQLTIDNLAHDPAKFPILLLSGQSDQIAELYEVEAYADEKYHVYHLSPKTENHYFASVSLVFLEDKPSSIVIRDAMGRFTEITFTETEVNTGLSDEVFEFSAPDGVDIVDQRTIAGDS